MSNTPKEAIKQFCRNCVSGDYRHVAECQGDTVSCPLFRHRMKEGKIPVRVIRLACLNCMGDNRELVFCCTTEDCPLHEYRMGKNEAHKNRPRPVNAFQIKQGLTV